LIVLAGAVVAGAVVLVVVVVLVLVVVVHSDGDGRVGLAGAVEGAVLLVVAT
jgi:hypothetical protein